MCVKHSIAEQAELSWKAMSEFYHDLLMQALSKRNREIMLNFDAICELAMTIKYIMQKLDLCFYNGGADEKCYF